ncbi:MAG: aldo/keto reductase [Bryobacteraceae bacterium]
MVEAVTLPSGATMPVFGLGTWHMGERRATRQAEVDALRTGLDLGATLIDTAEMYADGGAEEVVAEAIDGRGDQVYVVSKVYPHNAGRRKMKEACERSLKRLRTDQIDLYLLHWRGSAPLEETFSAFQELRQEGKIADFGVSNFDQDDLEEMTLWDAGQNGTNQILYNLARREAEWSVLPWCRERGIPVMAYCPLDEGRLLTRPAIRAVAQRHGATPAQVALAWLLAHDGVAVIPKSSNPERVRENVAALQIRLTQQDLTELDRAFPPPKRPTRLGMI